MGDLLLPRCGSPFGQRNRIASERKFERRFAKWSVLPRGLEMTGVDLSLATGKRQKSLRELRGQAPFVSFFK